MMAKEDDPSLLGFGSFSGANSRLKLQKGGQSIKVARCHTANIFVSILYHGILSLTHQKVDPKFGGSLNKI